MQPVTNKLRKYSAEGTISNMRSFGDYYISIYISEMQQILIYDTSLQIIIKKITLP